MAEDYKPYSLVKEKGKTITEVTDKEGKKMEKSVVTEIRETAVYYTERGLSQLAFESKQKEPDAEKNDKA